jgi:hypothetical protein
VAAINADATFGANGTAVVTASSAGKTLAASNAGVAITCASGATTVTATVTMNGPVSSLAGDFAHGSVTLVNGTVALALAGAQVESGVWNTNMAAGTVKVAFPLTAATQSFVSGTTTIKFAANALTTLNAVTNSAISTVTLY